MAVCPFCEFQIPGGVAEPQLVGCSQCLNPLLLNLVSGRIEAVPVPGMLDVRQAAPEGSMGGELLRSLGAALDDLAVLPGVAQRVLAASQNPDTGLNEMANLIGEDVVLAMQVLQLANSALYGGLSSVKDLPTACARLGMKKVANAVQAVAYGRLYNTSRTQFAPVVQQLWRHAVASAHCANAITGIAAQAGADVLFVGGLVHEIGKLTAITAIDRAEEGPLLTLRESPELLFEVLEAWEPVLGLHAIQRWGLPTELAVATYFHHNPDTAPYEAWLPIVHIVSLGCAVADACGFHTGTPFEGSLVSHPSASYLGLTDLKLATLQVDLEDRVQPMFALAGSN